MILGLHGKVWWGMYKIIVDSCGELPEELKKDGHFMTVSLELEVGGARIRDDETFDQLDFLRRVDTSEDEIMHYSVGGTTAYVKA